jgi:hypothetical protein
VTDLAAGLRALFVAIRDVVRLPASDPEEIEKNLALIDYLAETGVHRIDGDFGEEI